MSDSPDVYINLAQQDSRSYELEYIPFNRSSSSSNIFLAVHVVSVTAAWVVMWDICPEVYLWGFLWIFFRDDHQAWGPYNYLRLISLAVFGMIIAYSKRTCTVFLVGLTGGIATGKSTVSNVFRDFGCIILDADLIAREVVEPGTKALESIRLHFGEEVIKEDGTLNRTKLGEIIFSNESRRKQLNSITHPEIYKAMLGKIIYYAWAGYQFVILDLPLLFESKKMLPYMTEIIVVSCDRDQQVKRLMARNNYNESEALSRIHSQMSLEEKCTKATCIIDNSGSIQQTIQQVEEKLSSIKRSKAHWKLRLVLLGVASILLYSAYHVCRLIGVTS